MNSKEGTTADTAAALGTLPPLDASDDDWMAWANAYATLEAANMRCILIDKERADFAVETSVYPLNPNGAVNGGLVSLLVDQAMGVLAIRTAAPGSQPATAVLQVHFHKPAFAPLRLQARWLPGGRNISTVAVEVTNAQGLHCVTAIGTMAVKSVGRTSR